MKRKWPLHCDRTITLFAGGGGGPGGISEPGPPPRRPAAMPVCSTLLPVVDAAGIQVVKDKFRCEMLLESPFLDLYLRKHLTTLSS